MATTDESATDESQAPPQLHGKYTSSLMPKIHDEDPASLLAGLDKDQINSWLSIATGKVLVRPFDAGVKYQPNHIRIAKSILTAAKDITRATGAVVARPTPAQKSARKRQSRHPITFLIHDISKADEEMLLSREVWSSKEITFQVSPVNVRRPDFLFTLTGFVTDRPELVTSCVMETWSDEITDKLLHKLADEALTEAEQLDRLNEMISFLESATVEYLDIKSGGGQSNPHFNIYADGEAIEDHKTWIELRKALKSHVYRSATIGDGKATKNDFICGLCHGHDHPRGLCEFPHIRGWNGGGRNPGFLNSAATQGETHLLAARPWNKHRNSHNNTYQQPKAGPATCWN